MEWRDEGVLLSLRKHGESSAIIEVLTREHGRHAGLARGAGSRKLAPLLQPGAQLSLVWRARLTDHLGAFRLEVVKSRAAAAMATREGLECLNAFCALCLAFLPERQSAPEIYEAAMEFLDALGAPARRRAAYARWELCLLREIGFGLDFSRCALSGARDPANLAYVSPQTGRAVSREAGAPWADKALALPRFLVDGAMEEAAPQDFAQALRLSGHFLRNWAASMHEQEDLPPARLRLEDLTATSK